MEELVSEEARIELREVDGGKHMNILNFSKRSETFLVTDPVKRSQFKTFRRKRSWNCGQHGHLIKAI